MFRRGEHQELEVLIKSLQERQERQEEQLEEQKRIIAELREELAQTRKEFAEREAPKESDLKADREADEGHIAMYVFNPSMWDAMLLLFFERVDITDKLILLLGGTVNILLQGLLVAAIWADMLDDPYPLTKVQEMIAWRVDHGHPDDYLDTVSGSSYLERLCNNQLWSWEQGEYEEMFRYLYLDMPGWVLNVLALVMWVMTLLVEYRGLVEQAMAIISLPGHHSGQQCLTDTEDGGIKILGIQNYMRVLALIMLPLCRLAIVGLLWLIGCQYLAQTASLSDIVLNAVALAFVLDIDELAFTVFSSQRLRHLIEKLEPLPCSHTRGRMVGTLTYKDLIRYLLAVGMILGACLGFLWPFWMRVEGAATALCGGQYDFSYGGGHADRPTIVLKNTTIRADLCDAPTMSTYFAEHYGISYNATARPAESIADTSYEEIRQKVVMRFGLKGCPPGEVLKPVDYRAEGQDSARECIPIPQTFSAVLDFDPGEDFNPASCARFQPDLGRDACADQPTPEVCTWTWLAIKCESSPPGAFHREACEPESLEQECKVWEDLFGREHPTKNCLILEKCPQSDLACFVIRGSLELSLRNESAFMENSSLTEATMLASLATVAGMEEEDIILEMDWSSRRLNVRGQQPDNRSTVVVAQYILMGTPEDLKPNDWLNSSDELLAEINAGLVANDTGIIVSQASLSGTELTTKEEIAADLFAEGGVDRPPGPPS